jgi:hypothetical protein
VVTRARSLSLLLITLTGVACLSACGAKRTSLYAPLAPNSCVAPPPEILRIYAERDLGVEECPAPSPYRLFVVSSDTRSWVDLVRNNVIWSTEERIVYAQDVLALGHFPNVGGSDMAEWRLNKKGEPVAVIVRLRLVDPAQIASEGATVSRLVVIGLSEDAACDLGLAASNEEARQLADAAPATCAASLPRIVPP